MHGLVKRGVVVAAGLAVAVACADKATDADDLGLVGSFLVGPQVAPQQGRVIASKTSETVTVTANCMAGNQIDVAVDKWVIDVKKNSEVTFVLSSTSRPAPTVTVVPKSAADWPFTDGALLRPGKGGGKGPGNGKGKVKGANGKYHYNLRVACSVGTGKDSTRVVIDPDIFVD
jgi:hypothetical protein